MRNGAWDEEDRDILTQAEAGNPAAGERYANTLVDQMMLSLVSVAAFPCSSRCS